MGSAAAITITGTEELKLALAALGADLSKELIKAGKKAMAINVEANAKRKCVVDTGNLRGSISTQEAFESGRTIIKTGTNVFYAPYIEYGTGIYAANGDGRKTPWVWPVNSPKWQKIFFGSSSKAGAYGPGRPSPLWFGSHPHPFLRPAFDENKEKVLESIKETLKVRVRDLATKRVRSMK